MTLYHRKFRGRILLILFALYPIKSLAHALDQSFVECFANVISCAENPSNSTCISTLDISSTTAFSVLRTSNGSIIPPALGSLEAATALSYAGCEQYCGTGPQFYWDTFSQDYSTWLLPYLSLLSQLPFGARRRVDNLMSLVLTLGSPVLAGYSLYLTFLNARWVNDQLFADIHYPGIAVRQSVVRVLSGLQQTPLRVHPGEPDAHFESLIVHPDNDHWWSSLAEELGCSQNSWSIASAASILWVFIAYLLTVANSISILAQTNSNGDGISSSWLWLLPVVIGWLVLSPKCHDKRVHDAYNKTNKKVFAVYSNNAREAPAPVTSNFGLTITPSSEWEQRMNIISPDESRTPPIFNYSRVWLWAQNVYVVSLFYRAACKRSNLRIGVDTEPIPGVIRNDIPRESRLGSREQIIQYCRPDNEYSSALWPRGMFRNMIIASLMALQLQWGTTLAAVLGMIFTPTTGLGCRSLAHLLCGALSTTAWIFLVSSSMLGYYAHHLLNDLLAPDIENTGKQPLFMPPSPSISIVTPIDTDGGPGLLVGENVAIPLREIRVPHSAASCADQGDPPSVTPDKHADASRLRWARLLARLADLLRWIGKAIAIINAIGTITNSLFDYTGVYSNCFCNSSAFTWGSRAFVVIAPSQSDIRLEGSALIGALALAFTSCGVFLGSIYLLRDSLPS